MQFKGEYPFNFHWGVKDTFMSEKAQIYSEADKTALIEIKSGYLFGYATSHERRDKTSTRLSVSREL